MSEAPCRKRDDYLEWPEYFMAVAFLSAQRSKDPNSQVGACIVNAENKIVGIGYNGMPNGCSDDVLPWRRTAERKLDTKYPYASTQGLINTFTLREEKIDPTLIDTRLAWYAAAEHMKPSVMVCKLEHHRLSSYVMPLCPNVNKRQ
ncbi:deoxycytidylate deaminase isoform X1 [Panthera uncia]|uniref:deoxycytidylate deaminase isoform X1 n=1 Tax=Panthera uncia TaxID=29064 RepID=UPI0020FFC62F|nr:deoxycytidylate deaminase isoform X1 [Panthera uncia]